jgi:2-oxoglutarate ferredoxin oxidoreductase subunit alpha
MPTRHEQGDLNLALYGGHGELQRIVLAPVSVTDCIWQTINAFNLAEQYQVPVLLLSDTVLAVRTESIPKPDVANVKPVYRETYQGNGDGIPAAEHRYLRYEYTDNGIAPMAIPGTDGGQYVATGLEHNEAGRPRYDSATHADMTRKRFRKMGLAAAAAPSAHEYGDPDAEVGVITWGSTWGAVVEAVDRLAEQGIKVHALAPRQILPLPDHQIRPFMESKRIVLVPEVNFTGQFADLLQIHYQRELQRVNVFGGQPFQVGDIVDAIVGVHQHVG